MALKDTLTTIILAGTLSLANTSCSKNIDHSQYSYKGWLGEEEIQFEEQHDFFSNQNILTVKKNKTKGNEYTRTIIYNDRLGDDLKLEDVTIVTHVFNIHFPNDPTPTIINYDTTQKYTIDKPEEKVILVEAQSQFDTYLQQIKKENQRQQEEHTKKGLESLK